MSFENVGLTPGDHYWVFVNRKNHRVEKWQMVLQGHQPPPDEYTWEGWEQHDGLWFPTAHKGADATTIYTRNVATRPPFPPRSSRGTLSHPIELRPRPTDGGTTALRVSETFFSLQGEGPSACTPAHFIRLQGCDVGCRWCDTKYSWGNRPAAATRRSISCSWTCGPSAARTCSW